jgi:hypothetical protein
MSTMTVEHRTVIDGLTINPGDRIRLTPAPPEYWTLAQVVDAVLGYVIPNLIIVAIHLVALLALMLVTR